MSPLGWIVVSGLLMTTIAVAGAVTFFLPERSRERIILPLVAFSAGSLLGGAFFHMLPEATAAGGGAIGVYVWVLLGFATFFALEQLLHWQHCHHHAEVSRAPLSTLILAGDGVHNFLGGVAVAAAFLIDTALGISTLLAAAAHEIPQELGKYGVLLHGGYERGRALLVNVLTSLTFLAGGLVTFGASTQLEIGFVLPFAAGNFIYVGAADLVPEVNKHQRLGIGALHFAAFSAGVLLLLAVRVWLEPA